MRREDGATILDVLNASRKALDFLGDLDLAGLLADEKTQSAVLHQLLVIGEAVKTDVPDLLERLRDATPDREST